jgi:hypothetical protein
MRTVPIQRIHLSYFKTKLIQNTYWGVPLLAVGSGYSVLPSVGAVHHASRRVPTIPHAQAIPP